MIVHHNCICIKLIMIFSFMKFAIKLLIVITCFFVYNIVILWPFHKYFSIVQSPPILTVLKIKYFFWPQDILNISCTKDYEMHLFIFICLQALTWSCTWELCSPSPCLESINICWFQEKLWWRGKIFYHVTWNLPREKWIYQKYSMTWHEIFSKILSYSSEQAQLLTR
jgi:hypothetical protein